MSGSLHHESLRALHGREAELALIQGALGDLSGGMGTVIVVQGDAGMGKSRLLAEIFALAHDRGARVGGSVADPSESVVELSALLAALCQGTDPLLDPHGLDGLERLPGQRFWLLRDVQGLLERAAMASPLLIGIDDAQWADGGTAAALRTLPAQLAGLPIAWVLATRPMSTWTPMTRAIDELQRAGGVTVSLGPLGTAAAAEVCRELLGAEPDDEVLRLVEEAGGSPFLLVEMLLGLQEDGLVRVEGGRAELIERCLPHRMEDQMRERLSRLSEAAGNAAIVAASLGRTFSFGDLALTIGLSPAELISPVNELVAANLLRELDDGLVFWHDITREAVRASVPISARRALDRQAAGVLVESGALPVEVAVQVAGSARPGDDAAVSILADAARTLLKTDPAAAAKFGESALEIVSEGHPRRGEIVGTTAIALHVAGKAEEAIAFADTALSGILPPDQEAEVRLSIAGMFSISPDTRIAAGRTALRLSGVPETTRARHFACLFHNYVTAGRVDEAGAVLAQAHEAVDPSGDRLAIFALDNAESAFEYGHDRFALALELAGRACRGGVSAGDDQRLRLAQHWRGEVLSTLDRHDEAFVIASDGLAAAQRDRHAWAYEMFDVWRARLLLRVGRLSEAAAVLEGRLSLEDGYYAVAVLDAAGIVALGRVAIHMRDRRQIRRLNEIARVMAGRGTPAIQRHAAWLLALFANAEGDPHRACEWLRHPTDAAAITVVPRFPFDVADDIQLARIALQAGDDELADTALASTARRAERNPEVASFAAAAAQVRGLVQRDPKQLLDAATLFEKSGRPLEVAMALEDVGAYLTQAGEASGVERLGDALTLFTELGATWDAGRARSRLRALGVRRRIVESEPETTGWAAVTPAELAVVELVGDGLTNREVAERLFVSPHTVNSHLRHVFTKLRINTRVELAVMVAEHQARSATSPEL